jgi:hypothetical protein
MAIGEQSRMRPERVMEKIQDLVEVAVYTEPSIKS